MGRSRYILLIIAVLYSFFASGQTNRDVIVNYRQFYKYDSIVERYLYVNPLKALEIVNDGLQRAEDLKHNWQKAYLYELLMDIYRELEQPVVSINYGYKALLLYDLYDIKELYHEVVLGLSASYFKAEFCDNYILNLLADSKQFFKSSGDSVNYIKAQAFYMYFSHLSGKKVTDTITRYPHELADDISDFMQVYSVLARYYYKTGNKRKALAIYKKMEAYLSEHNLFYYHVNDLHFARFYIEEKNLRAAQVLVDRSLPYFKAYGDVVHQADANFLKAEIYFYLQQYYDAIKYAQKALVLSEKYHILGLSSRISFFLSEIYIHTGQNDLALFSYSKSVKIRDSIYSLEKLYQVSNNQLKITSLEKEKENYKLRKEKEYESLRNRQQKLVIFIIALVALIFAILLGFVYFMLQINIRDSQRLKRFAQVSQEGIIIADRYDILEYNDRFLQLTKYQDKEISGLSLKDFLDSRTAAQIIETDGSFFVETNVKRKDGTYFIAEILAKPFPYHRSRNAKVISLHDVTEFRKAQRELIESQLRFKTLIDTSPDGVILTDLEGKITYISKATLAMLGSESLYYFMDKYLYEIVDTSDTNLIKETVNNLKASNNTLQRDFKLIITGSRVVYVECRCTTVRNTQGEITGLFFILRDVTQRYLAQEALIRSEAKFRGLFDKASDGIMIVDHNGIVEEANKAASDIFGLNLEELTGKKFTDLLPVSVRKSYRLYDILRSDKKFETVLFRTNDEMIYVQISVSMLTDKPKPLYLFIIRDITELRKNQERLKRYADKLEASNNAKAKLFSIISHDLRGPIGNLKTMIELILDSPESFRTDELKEILVALKDTSVSTYELLENLLYWSRSQLNQIDYNPTVFSLSKIVESTISLFKESTKLKEITIENHITDGNLKVKADVEMVKTILRNLISNAIKFTPHGGKIVLRNYSDVETVIIAVKDTGIGITHEKLMEIFDSAKFVSTRGTDNEKGTGLGLDLVRDFVQRNKGKLWVESKPGKGSTFYFSLPKA